MLRRPRGGNCALNSTDLATWTSGADVACVSEAHNADGTATYVWRSTHPATESPREFLRLRITKP